MANGDAAAAIGMDVVPGTDDIRDSYDEINKSRDYVANHITDGAHRADQITSGIFPVARGGTGRSNIWNSPTDSNADPDTKRIVVVSSDGSLQALRDGDIAPQYMGMEFHFGEWASVDFDDGQAVEPHGAPFTPQIIIMNALMTAASGFVVVTARADLDPANGTNVFLRAKNHDGTPYGATVSKIHYMCMRPVIS